MCRAVSSVIIVVLSISLFVICVKTLISTIGQRTIQTTSLSPTPLTLPPSLSPTAYLCVPNGDEYTTYGNTSATRANVSFVYEIEVESSIFDKMSTEVIPAVEKAITDSLLRDLFRLCGSIPTSKPDNIFIYDSNKPKHNITTRSTYHDRSLEVVGVTSNPPDVFDEKENCKSIQAGNNSMCAHIQGEISLYFDDGTKDIDKETAANQALVFVRESMKEGSFRNSHEGIVNMTVIEASVNDQPRSIIPQIEESDVSSTIDLLFLVGGLIIAVLVTMISLGFVQPPKGEPEEVYTKTKTDDASSLSPISDLDDDSSYESLESNVFSEAKEMECV